MAGAHPRPSTTKLTRTSRNRLAGPGDGSRTVTIDFAVETEGLTRCFGSVVAVNEVGLPVPAGSIYALLGPNGAGKSYRHKHASAACRRANA